MSPKSPHFRPRRNLTRPIRSSGLSICGWLIRPCFTFVNSLAGCVGVERAAGRGRVLQFFALPLPYRPRAFCSPQGGSAIAAAPSAQATVSVPVLAGSLPVITRADLQLKNRRCRNFPWSFFPAIRRLRWLRNICAFGSILPKQFPGRKNKTSVLFGEIASIDFHKRAGVHAATPASILRTLGAHLIGNDAPCSAHAVQPEQFRHKAFNPQAMFKPETETWRGRYQIANGDPSTRLNRSAQFGQTPMQVKKAQCRTACYVIKRRCPKRQSIGAGNDPRHVCFVRFGLASACQGHHRWRGVDPDHEGCAFC